MKHLSAFTFLFLLLWLLVRPAAAQVANDTLPGEAHLTALFARGICEQIALESRHQDLAVLTRSQGMGLMQEVLTAAIIRDSLAFRTFLASTPETATAVQRVTMQAMVRLTTMCPLTSRLLMQMGAHMTGLDTNLSTVQQQLLETVAHDLCGRLALADTQLAFGRRTAPERIAAYQEARHQVILARGQALLAAFGEQLLADQQLESTMWQNVDQLMYDQCPALTSQLRVDQGMAQLRETRAPEPAPPLPASVKPAIRTARRK